MSFRRSFSLVAMIAVAGLLSTTAGAVAVQTSPTLPSEISDADFWRMIVELSEPAGTYPYVPIYSRNGVNGILKVVGWDSIMCCRL